MDLKKGQNQGTDKRTQEGYLTSTKIHGIGNGSREPITFVCRSACTPCCKISNVVFTFVLTDFRLAHERDIKNRSTTVFTRGFEYSDFHRLGFVLGFVLVLVANCVGQL